MYTYSALDRFIYPVAQLKSSCIFMHFYIKCPVKYPVKLTTLPFGVSVTLFESNNIIAHVVTILHNI